MLGELGITSLDIGAGALVVITILMVFTARLVPKRYYDEALRRVEEERAAKEDWRRAAEALLQQNTLLLQQDDVSIHALHAIRTSIEGGNVET